MPLALQSYKDIETIIKVLVMQELSNEDNVTTKTKAHTLELCENAGKMLQLLTMVV